MAKLWLTYREGLRLLGFPLAEVPLETATARLDIAPWRLFTSEAPERVAAEQLRNAPERKRALLEVTGSDRYDLCGLVVGFYDSPYSTRECLRRLGVGADGIVDSRPTAVS